MKKMLCGIGLALCANAGFADTNSVQQKLAQNYPDMPFQQLQKTPLNGIYSALLEGEVFYVNESAEYVIAGPMIRLKDGKNLSQTLEMQAKSIDWKSLPLQDAIKVVKGNGKRQLVVFSDPNCPYCQKLEKELAQLKDVTIYTFVVAFKPQSVALSKKIFCEKNVALAWENYLNKGIEPKGNQSCENPVERNLVLAKKLNVTGTPSLVFANGYQVLGGLPAPSIEKMWQELGL